MTSKLSSSVVLHLEGQRTITVDLETIPWPPPTLIERSGTKFSLADYVTSPNTEVFYGRVAAKAA